MIKYLYNQILKTVTKTVRHNMLAESRCLVRTDSKSQVTHRFRVEDLSRERDTALLGSYVPRVKGKAFLEA